MSETVVFSALLRGDEYMAGLWDLVLDEGARSYWLSALKLNSRHMLDSYMKTATPPMKGSCDEAHNRFCRFLDGFESELSAEGPRTVNDLVEVRQKIFTECGIPDPYRDLKAADNERALALLEGCPNTLPEEVPERERLRWIASLVMAGNLLDMGSAEARLLHKNEKLSVFQRTAEVARKNWFMDQLKELEAALKRGPRGKGLVVVCIDNAGAEIVLGVTTLVKYLTSLDYTCVIAANEVPSLNDMTAEETLPLLHSVARVDPELDVLLSSGSLSVISSGSVTSGLNMLKVSPDFDCAASKAELLILLGQGRAVETNWKTELSVPWARIATVKDPFVAGAVGCEVFDPLLTLDGGL